MTCQYVLDPSLFIWDEINYEHLRPQYFELSCYLIDLIDAIEELPVTMTQEVSLTILEQFPFTHVCEFDGLRELGSVFYSFISKLIGEQDTESVAIEIEIEPKPFCYNLNNFKPKIANNLFYHCFITNSDYFFVSHYNFWDKSKSRLKLSLDNKEKCLDVLSNITTVICSRECFGRIFEQSEKHMRGGFGSILEIDEELASLLLADAVEVSSESKALVNCYRNERGETVYVVFRPHDKNKYHAYPVNPKKIPQNIRAKLGQQ